MLQQSYYIALILAALLVSCGGSRPLWPGAKYTEADRTNALLRALGFIERSAEKNFDAQDSDYVYCLYSISATARDPKLRDAADRLAHRYAHHFAQKYPSVPANASVNEIAHLIFGWYPAALLGEDDSRVKPQLRTAAARYNATQFLGFDPGKEPPPNDLTDPCEYDHYRNPRGVKLCKRCGRPLQVRSKYEVWIDALVDTYSGDIYGIHMGAPFRDVVQWIPAMRPYPDPRRASQAEFIDCLYSLTHLVYALNDYGHYLLSRDLLPVEYAYLRQHLPAAISLHDPETMGEFLDSLKAFGLDNSDPVIRTGMTYLLENQRPDGTWGSPNETDFYTLYHSAWTGIDGLKDCRWEGERLSMPELRPLLESIAKIKASVP